MGKEQNLAGNGKSWVRGGGWQAALAQTASPKPPGRSTVNPPGTPGRQTPCCSERFPTNIPVKNCRIHPHLQNLSFLLTPQLSSPKFGSGWHCSGRCTVPPLSSVEKTPLLKRRGQIRGSAGGVRVEWWGLNDFQQPVDAALPPLPRGEAAGGPTLLSLRSHSELLPLSFFWRGGKDARYFGSFPKQLPRQR